MASVIIVLFLGVASVVSMFARHRLRRVDRAWRYGEYGLIVSYVLVSITLGVAGVVGAAWVAVRLVLWDMTYDPSKDLEVPS